MYFLIVYSIVNELHDSLYTCYIPVLVFIFSALLTIHRSKQLLETFLACFLAVFENIVCTFMQISDIFKIP